MTFAAPCSHLQTRRLWARSHICPPENSLTTLSIWGGGYRYTVVGTNLVWTQRMKINYQFKMSISLTQYLKINIKDDNALFNYNISFRHKTHKGCDLQITPTWVTAWFTQKLILSYSILFSVHIDSLELVLWPSWAVRPSYPRKGWLFLKHVPISIAQTRRTFIGTQV